MTNILCIKIISSDVKTTFGKLEVPAARRHFELWRVLHALPVSTLNQYIYNDRSAPSICSHKTRYHLK